MSHSLRLDPVRRNLTVLLVADSPPSQRRTDPETPVAREEAIISIARATFAVGGTVAVPLDAGIALLLGTLALEYLEPRAAERRNEPPPAPPVTVIETHDGIDPARRLLEPLVARGAVRLLDQQGNEVVPAALTEAEIAGINDVARHSLTASMIDVVNPRFVVLINPGRRVIADVSVLRARPHPVRVFRFGTEDAGDGGVQAQLAELDVEDPTGRLLDDTTPSPWTDDDEPRAARAAVPPYAYLMQRLIAEFD